MSAGGAVQPGQLACADQVYENAGNVPLVSLIQAFARPGRALDCGCGAGDNARLLRSAGWSVAGVTISAKERDAAASVCSEVYLGDLEQGIPAEAGGDYDLVALSHVLEHLIDPGKVLADTRSRLKTGGVLAVALPNVAFYKVRFQFLRGRFEYESAGLMDSTHYRFYTFASGARLLQSHGFEILSAGAEGAFPLSVLRQVLPGATIEAIDRGACRLWPGLFGYQLLYIARAV